AAGLSSYGEAGTAGVTAAELQSADFAEKLGGAFIADIQNLNNGYPVLAWQRARLADVADGAWYADAANYVVGAGLFDLTGANFKPDAPMTRLMLAEALWRLEGSPRAASEKPFTDTDAPSVVWALNAEIVNGTGDGKFSPNNSITREQIAAMLYRYAAYKKADLSAAGDLSVFSDAAKISGYAKTNMEWAVGKKLINGMGDGTVNPQGTASRAQVAQILLNYSK
ncbi:MAG: S-layer homology domain-containing protein, partial [Oscillospiraceae bacterium]|nr:S-layer homology domain-containing protein [Oscillospiraceae bacterium]